MRIMAVQVIIGSGTKLDLNFIWILSYDLCTPSVDKTNFTFVELSRILPLSSSTSPERHPQNADQTTQESVRPPRSICAIRTPLTTCTTVRSADTSLPDMGVSERYDGFRGSACDSDGVCGIESNT